MYSASFSLQSRLNMYKEGITFQQCVYKHVHVCLSKVGCTQTVCYMYYNSGKNMLVHVHVHILYMHVSSNMYDIA